MWDYVDNELKTYNKEYDKINRETLDEFQNILDKDVDLDEYATKSDLNRLQREITTNYEYLSEYGKYEARKRLKRTRIKYSDWFWFYFFMIYSLQAYQLAKIEDIIFNQCDIEFEFDKYTDGGEEYENGSLPYKDFLFFKNEYEVIIRIVGDSNE